MTIPSNPLSRKEYAIQLLDLIKADLQADELDIAASQLTQLNQHIQEWQRSENLQAARAWLDTALQGDLLAFDVGLAQRYLQQWETATDTIEDNPELTDYQAQVAAKTTQKNTALLVRGVISHCDDILDEAGRLETSAEPPAPTFMLSHYYGKVQKIVLSAQAEHPNQAELDSLVQRIERLHNNKETASQLYSLALESEKYSNALYNLEQLPDDFLIPRFTAIGQSDDIRLQYEGMVAISTARDELTRLAEVWASNITSAAMTASQDYLEAHNPREALDELALGENIEKFLDSEQKEALQSTKSEAMTQLRTKEKAEERLQKATELLETEALKAWEQYQSAAKIYRWADGLEETRQNILTALQSQLSQIVHEADVTFHEARDMARVRDICQQAKRDYADKDALLDELLAQVDDLEDMVEHYEDYIATGNNILAKVRENIWQDAIAANELLTQVESYPEFVLQAFNDLYDLRAQVNQRLNADQTYNQLYPSLFSDVLPDITEAIERTNVAASDFEQDERFQRLESWLKYHMAFVTAQQQFKTGASEQVLQLIAPVLNYPQHPDYEAAMTMQQAIQAQSAATTDNDAEASDS